MKWFKIDKGYDYTDDGRESLLYEMYNLNSGVVFFRYVRRPSGITMIKTLDEFLPIKQGLINICLSVKDFDKEMSYDMYILPLLRDKKLKELGI